MALRERRYRHNRYAPF